MPLAVDNLDPRYSVFVPSLFYTYKNRSWSLSIIIVIKKSLTQYTMLVCIKGARTLSTKLTSKRVKSDAVYFGHNYQINV